MNNKAAIMLATMYDKTKAECIRQKKKIINGSVFFTLIKPSSNIRYRILNNSSTQATIIPIDILNNFLEKGFVQYTDKGTHITLTGAGFWYVEKTMQNKNPEQLICFLDNELFKLFSETKSLDTKEKTILLTLVAARAFSPESAVDMTKSDRINNEWGKIIDSSYAFLESHNSVEKWPREKLYGKAGNEHPVSSCIRHTDSLPKKTRGIFIAPRDRTYFLNIYRDGKTHTLDISFLFEIIFENKLDMAIMDHIYNFCCKISSQKSIYLFENIEKHIFATHNYDEVIKKALRDAVFKSKR
jgi:hypothetical protein